MQAFISAKNNQEIIVLPYLMEDPEIAQPQKNEDFGDMKLIGNLGLKQVPLKAFLPSKPMRGMAKGSVANPKYYSDWINRLRGENIPLRLVLVRHDGTEFLNMPVIINNFVEVPIKNGHSIIELDLEEFRFKNIKVV